jgi:putative membrane protein
MALADSVPGVSGGTIAFLLGFYDEFINSLNDMIGKDNTKRKAALIFLIKLGIGWVIGFGASVMVLSSLFQAHIYEISSVFLGLTLFAIPLVVKEEWDSIHGKAGCLIFTLAGTVLVFCISYFNTSNRDGISVNFEHLTVGLGLYLFLQPWLPLPPWCFREFPVLPCF